MNLVNNCPSCRKIYKYKKELLTHICYPFFKCAHCDKMTRNKENDGKTILQEYDEEEILCRDCYSYWLLHL